MLLGIDVGGTHTDAVILNKGTVVASAKVLTDHDNLLLSIRTALEAVLTDVDPGAVNRVNLSTTLSTNAIIEGKTEEVGLLVSSGPGIDPENSHVGGQYHIIPGCVDHRGTEIQALDQDALGAAVQAMHQAGIRVFATVGKFSTRNPGHELAMAGAIGADRTDHITRGHTLSGVLNFPRRIATAYFNSAVWRTYTDFAWAIEESAEDFGLGADIYVLKADGGTMPLEASKQMPVESIMSGPAASVMGMIALCDIQKDCVILDIGGTTTDIAVFADGAPLIEEEGMTVGSYPTLVNALKVRSIGIGGDSALHINSHGVSVGPDRKGPSLANCGPASKGNRKHCAPALTDALNMLGISRFGDVNASIKGIKKLAELWDMKPERLAQKAVDYAVNRIETAVQDLIFEVNERPVYTIFELLKGRRIRPSRYYVMGGPAEAMAPLLQEASGTQTRLPAHHAVANAIGAALTRPTLDVELFADTHKGQMLIPNLGVSRDIKGSYSLEQAEADAKQALTEALSDSGADMAGAQAEITESGAFNMVDDMRTIGRTIRVRCQVRPGIVGKAAV